LIASGEGHKNRNGKKLLKVRIYEQGHIEKKKEKEISERSGKYGQLDKVQSIKTDKKRALAGKKLREKTEPPRGKGRKDMIPKKTPPSTRLIPAPTPR